MKDRETVAELLALGAFDEGFRVGADAAKRGKGRTLAEATTHAHWRAGFEAGRHAQRMARDRYKERLRDETCDARMFTAATGRTSP